MDPDITSILESWDYKPGQVMVRRIKGRDGVEKLQLRVDLGLMQMNVEGRPDGKRPMGQDSWLDFYLNRLEEHRADNDDDDEDFLLTAEDCSRLHQESLQYHHRYICLLQLEDYEAVIRDTERNLEVYDFVDEYAETDEAAWAFQQFRSQLILMDTRARALLELKADQYENALKLIDDGIESLKSFHQVYHPDDTLDSAGEYQALKTWREEVANRRPLSELERLERALKDAVSKEDYETAARMRDAIKELESSES